MNPTSTIDSVPAFCCLFGALGGDGGLASDMSDLTTTPALLAAPAKTGIGFKNAFHAVAAGTKVCDLAKAGKAQLEILSAIRSHNPGFSFDRAATFTELAANTYCPDQMAAGSGQGGDDTG